jgi:hypothetical protein
MQVGFLGGADAQIFVVQGILTPSVPLTSTAAQLFVLSIKTAFCGPIIRDSNIV